MERKFNRRIFGILLITLCLLNVSVASNILTLDFIIEYFKENRLSTVTLFTCWGEFELEVIRRFSLANIRICVHKDLSSEILSSLQEDLYHSEGIVVDSSCETSTDILQTASRHRIFTFQRHWLFLTETSNASAGELHVPQYWNYLYVLVDSLVVIAAFSPEGNVDLHTIFKDADYHPLQVDKIGTWSPDSGIYIEWTEEHRRKSNLHGALLTALTTVKNSVLIGGDPKPGLQNYDAWSIINNIMILHLEETLNFSVRVYVTEHQTNAMTMRTFQKYEADLLADGLLMNPRLWDFVDFPSDSVPFRACFIFRKPPLSALYNLYLMPFSFGIWECLVSFIILFVLLLVWQLRHDRELHPFLNKVFHWGDIVLNVVGTLCKQGIPVSPIASSARITFLSMLIFSWILLAAYSASIQTLVQSTDDAVHDIMDILHGPFSIGLEDLEYNHEYFDDIRHIHIKSLYKKIDPKRAYLPAEEGLERVNRGLFAFHVDSNVAYDIIGKTMNDYERCGLMEMYLYTITLMGLPTRKNFPYKEVMSIKLRHFRETGLLSRELNRWISKKPDCTYQEERFTRVGIREVRTLLELWAIGLGLSLLFLGMENFYWKKLKKYKGRLQCWQSLLKFSRSPGKRRMNHRSPGHTAARVKEFRDLYYDQLYHNNN